MGHIREEQDAFAAASQEKALAAIGAGRFKNEIVPIEVPQRKGDLIVVDTDEFPRAGTTTVLAKLRPAFRERGHHLVTIGAGSMTEQRRSWWLDPAPSASLA